MLAGRTFVRPSEAALLWTAGTVAGLGAWYLGVAWAGGADVYAAAGDLPGLVVLAALVLPWWWRRGPGGRAGNAWIAALSVLAVLVTPPLWSAALLVPLAVAAVAGARAILPSVLVLVLLDSLNGSVVPAGSELAGPNTVLGGLVYLLPLFAVVVGLRALVLVLIDPARLFPGPAAPGATDPGGTST